jgi:hypothetical protein
MSLRRFVTALALLAIAFQAGCCCHKKHHCCQPCNACTSCYSSPAARLDAPSFAPVAPYEKPQY